MNHLEPTISDADCYSIIESKIISKTPFALTRFGDGEIQFLNNTVTKSMRAKCCKLWDYDNNEFDIFREFVYDTLIESLSKSDIIGIMGTNEVSTRLGDLSAWRIDRKLVNSLRDDNYEVCDHQVTRSKLFGDPNSFKRILHGASVNIISPNMQQLEKTNIGRILETNVTYTKATNNREELIQSLATIESDVVIYGTSLTGKDIGVKLKEMGKIAIDFGATLDAWAGIESRPWFKPGGLQEYCLIKEIK